MMKTPNRKPMKIITNRIFGIRRHPACHEGKPAVSSCFDRRMEMDRRNRGFSLGVLFLAVAYALLGLTQRCAAEGELFMFTEMGLREPTDHAWSLSLTGEVISYPGIFLILHDAEGRIMVAKDIPRGKYTPDNPFRVEIPADQKTGDYRAIFLAQQKDMMRQPLPMSSLAHEVYGYSQFAKSKEPKVWFKVAPGVSEYLFTGNRATVSVLDEKGNILRVSSNQPGVPSYRSELKIALEPGKIYGIGLEAFNFTVEPGVFLSLSPDGTFLPDSRLRDAPWWLSHEL